MRCYITRKVYVKVNAVFSSDGELTPKSFVWDDGRCFEIDRVYDYKLSASLKVGGHGMRYRCRVLGKDIFLFFEDGRWFMEGK